MADLTALREFRFASVDTSLLRVPVGPVVCHALRPLGGGSRPLPRTCRTESGKTLSALERGIHPHPPFNLAARCLRLMPRYHSRRGFPQGGDGLAVDPIRSPNPSGDPLSTTSGYRCLSGAGSGLPRLGGPGRDIALRGHPPGRISGIRSRRIRTDFRPPQPLSVRERVPQPHAPCSVGAMRSSGLAPKRLRTVTRP